MKTLLIFGLILVTNIPAVRAQYTLTNRVLEPPDFKELSQDDCYRAVYFALEQKLNLGPGYVSNVVYQLQIESLPNETKGPVLYLLGELRPTDRESFEVLIKNIDLYCIDRFGTSIDQKRWDRYPALGALTKIGRPVVNLVLDHLSKESNPLRRELMCTVLRRVEGKENASNKVKQKLASESSSAKRTNLELALKEMEK